MAYKESIAPAAVKAQLELQNPYPYTGAV